MTDFTYPNRDELKWLAVDLDNTLAVAIWPRPGIGAPIWANVHKLIAAHNAGWKIVIHTARTWADYELIEQFLDSHLIPFNSIVCGKLLAAAYIDDRNVDVYSESWIPA